MHIGNVLPERGGGGSAPRLREPLRTCGVEIENNLTTFRR